MKELDKDALLEEAKRRYPVGTKFKVVHSPEAIRKVTSHEKHDDTFVKASDGLHINFISDLIEGGKSSCISASVYFNGKWAEIVEEPKVETKEEFVLPEYWFLRFKTKEVFDELCKKYAPDFIFFENAGICNNPTKLKLGNYYYLTKDTKYGEEITFDQFKKYVLKEEVKEETMEEWSVGPILDKIKLNWNSSEKITRGLKKTPDLIDKTKVKVEIKRTKVKQIKL